MDVNDIMYVHIDRKRKLPVTVLLRALGFVTDKQILELFYESQDVRLGAGSGDEELVGKVAAEDVVNVETGEILLETNEEITDESVRNLRNAGIKTVKVFEIPNRGRGRCRPQHAEEGPDQDARKMRSTASTPSSGPGIRRVPSRRGTS